MRTRAHHRKYKGGTIYGYERKNQTGTGCAEHWATAGRPGGCATASQAVGPERISLDRDVDDRTSPAGALGAHSSDKSCDLVGFHRFSLCCRLCLAGFHNLEASGRDGFVDLPGTAGTTFPRRVNSKGRSDGIRSRGCFHRSIYGVRVSGLAVQRH